MTNDTPRPEVLSNAADELDAEIKKVFGDGIEEEQRDVIRAFDLNDEARDECIWMLDDLEARCGVNVDAVRQIIGITDK